VGFGGDLEVFVGGYDVGVYVGFGGCDVGVVVGVVVVGWVDFDFEVG